MSTNRTKIDWAYKQAARLLNASIHAEHYDRIRKVAAALRLAQRRGARLAKKYIPESVTVAGTTFPEIVRMIAELDALRPPLTAATIRECEKQLEAVELKPDANGNISFQVPRQVDNLGGYPTRCIHGRLLSNECGSCKGA